MKFKETTYSNSKEILANADYQAIPVMVSDTGVVADADGKKIVKAGTIGGGEGGSLVDATNRKFIVHNTQGVDGAQAEGVLLYDVDVTDGPHPGAMVTFGTIAGRKLPEPPCADAVTALKGRILFLA